MERQMISCHRGLAPISFPASWLEGFDMTSSFANCGGEGRIRFPNGRAFGVSVEHDGPEVTRLVVELSPEQVEETAWGKFCEPWEPYGVASVFGHGPVTRIE